MAAIKNKPMATGDDLANFEKGRIKALQEERLHIQKKTFTKWMNSFLVKARMEITDIFTDLSDGKKLLKLLEIISNEKLGKPNNGKMRVHFIENVNKSLAFLHTKVRLESIGAEDIVDGNPRLILGLIWTIILRFQIDIITEFQDDVEEQNSEKKSAKDALLLWCQRKTSGYSGVNINDFSPSWRSGLGFNALIHAHRPDLINYNSLVPTKHIENLNNAFDTAERDLGIPRLLDAEDIDCSKPDEKSVLTYVASMYHTFARMKSEQKGGRRIANILSQIMETNKLKETHETTTSILLQWIKDKTHELSTTTPPNTLPLIRKQLSNFTQYRTTEKPPKYKEKSEIEANYFNINIQLKQLNQASYNPPEGKLVHDIEKAWEQLEKCENQLERKLKIELLRQEKLEQVAVRFQRKADLREGYLKDMILVLSDKRYGMGIGQVEATLKKHEAISADIMAREPRCQQLQTMSSHLTTENYHDSVKIAERCAKIMTTWEELLALLNHHQKNLVKFSAISNVDREITTATEEIQNYSFESPPKQLEKVQLLLSNLSLTELSIGNLGEVVKKISKNPNADEQKVKKLNDLYKNLVAKSQEYRVELENSLAELQLLSEIQEEESWIDEKILQIGIKTKLDTKSVARQIIKLKNLKDEIKAREPTQQKLIDVARGENIDNNLEKKISELLSLVKEKEEKLAKLAKYFDFYADMVNIEDMVNEKKPLVGSQDYGIDEPSAQALLNRHRDLMIEINSFKSDVEALKNGDVAVDNEEEEFDYMSEEKLVPMEYYDEDVTERIEYVTVTEERSVPQVRALYPFTGQDNIEMQKNEIMFLLNKTNKDWWNVRKANGQDGFVPANYVKEIEPKVVMVQVRKPETIKEKTRVKKTKMVLQTVNKKVKSLPKEKQNLESRVVDVVKGYEDIVDLGEKRTNALKKSILTHTFNSEILDFTKYLNSQKALLTTEEDSIEAARKNFTKFLQTFSATTKRLDLISKQATELNSAEAGKKLKNITKLYEEVNYLKDLKEKSLEGASSVEGFYKQIDELEEWIVDKEGAITKHIPLTQLKSLHQLNSHATQIDRELQPINSKLVQLQQAGQSVSKKYPKETKQIQSKLNHCDELFKNLLKISDTRIKQLQNAVGREIFAKRFNELSDFSRSNLEKMDMFEISRTLSAVEEALKMHDIVFEEIESKREEFVEVIELGKSLGIEKANELENFIEALDAKWADRKVKLEQLLDLVVFEKEVRQQDLSEKVNALDWVSLGESFEEANYLYKKHSDFIQTLNASEERFVNFLTLAEKLEKVHPEKEKIKNSKELVIKNREEIKAKAKDRKELLQKSLRFYEFAEDVTEMVAWIEEKKLVAIGDDYKDVQNVQKKLLQHQVFNQELTANSSKLNSLEKTKQKLISENNRPADVTKLLDDLKQNWDELATLCEIKHAKLLQAEAQLCFNKAVEDLEEKLREVEDALSGDIVAKDRRSTRVEIKKQEMLENDLSNCEQKAADLLRLSQEMEREKHFNAGKISEVANNLAEKVENLKNPVAKRREALEELLRFYDFMYEVDIEAEWIGDKFNVLEVMAAIPADLHDASVKVKKMDKFIKEVENRGNNIKKVKQVGENLIAENHPEKKRIQKAILNLNKKYDDLVTLMMDKKKLIDGCYDEHSYYADANEVELWAAEKKVLLTSTDFGKDKATSVKLLTSQKQLELEIDTYTNIVKEKRNQIKKANPAFASMMSRQEALEQTMEELKSLSNDRSSKLIEHMNRHEFYQEARDFASWLEEMISVCSSEEYGVDYENLENLSARFQETKTRVKNGEHRMKSLSELARKLSNGKITPMDEEVKQMSVGDLHELICNRYATLIEYMNAREVKLDAAGEIHRFNRDVADALERINEKLAEIPEESGKDFNSCESLLRQMEAFESDLVPLEAQLQVLLNDSQKLSQKYPTNAPNITEEQQIVIETYNKLQQSTISKKLQITQNLDFYKFSSIYKTLSNYLTTVLKQLNQKINPKTDANLLITSHERLLSELNSRKDKFEHFYALGAEIEDSQEKVQELKKLENQVHLKYNQVKIYLDQLIDLQIFLRDVKLLENQLTQQDTILNKPITTTNIEEAEKFLKNHEELEKIIQNQSNKFELNEGKKLLEQNHFDKENIQSIVHSIINKRKEILEKSAKRKIELEKLLDYLRFKRDVEESLNWISEKEKQINSLKAVSLEDKVKKLKKHQKIEAEISVANVGDIVAKAEKIDQDAFKLLSEKWIGLLEMVRASGSGLEEAKALLKFEEELEEIEKVVREMEVVARGEDIGRDYESCLELLTKLTTDVEKTSTRIQNLNKQELKNEKLERLNEKWATLKKFLLGYKDKLEKALITHGFEKDCEDIRLRIKEKMPILRVEDLGKDLESVQSLLRKQETVEIEMGVIEEKIKELHDFESKLVVKSASMEMVTNDWAELSELCLRRRECLNDSLSYHTHLTTVRELETFTETTLTKLKTSPTPQNLKQSQQLLQDHMTTSEQIKLKLSKFAPVSKQMQQSITQSNIFTNELQNCLQIVTKNNDKLQKAMNTRQSDLESNLKLQEYLKLYAEFNNLATELETLTKVNLGDSLSMIVRAEKLIDLEGNKLLKIIEAKSKEVISFGEKINQDEKNKLVELKMLELFKLFEKKLSDLNDQKNYQNWLLNANETEGYLKEKLAIATDENYLEMVNLQSKIQKHTAFEAEVELCEERILNIEEWGGRVKNGGFKNEIEAKMENLRSIYADLRNSSDLKRDRLQQSHQALLFNQSLLDLEQFLDDLVFSETPENLPHAKSLLKKWMSNKTNYNSRQEIASNISKTGTQFQKSNHFMKDAIIERVTEVVNKFNDFESKIDEKIAQLEKQVSDFEYERDLGDYKNLIHEQLNVIATIEEVNSIEEVKKLLKKVETVSSEVESVSMTIKKLNDEALKSEYENLQTKIKDKTAQLNDNLEKLNFLSELNDCKFWIQHNNAVFATNDNGIDEESNLKLVKKFQNLKNSLDSYENIVVKLDEKSKVLKIETNLKEDFSNLQKLCDTRIQRLLDAGKLFKFLSLSDSFVEWCEMMMITAGSEDYGRDVENVEILINKFEAFYESSVNSGEAKLESVVVFSESLQEESHPDVEKITEKLQEVKSVWEEFKELSLARGEALDGARKVHQFDKHAEETIAWIREKFHSISNDYGSDLETIQGQMRKHLILVEDKSVENQLASVKLEGQVLKGEFPDASEHIELKLKETESVWQEFVAKVKERSERLTEAEVMQGYFDDYNELYLLLTNLTSKAQLLSVVLGVEEAESNLQRASKITLEKTNRNGDFEKFYSRGSKLLEQGHFLSNEIETKIKSLKEKQANFELLMSEKTRLMEQNVDLQSYYRDLDNFESMIDSVKEVNDNAESVTAIEEILRGFEDVEVFADLLSSRIGVVERKTLLEEWEELRVKEMKQKEDERRRGEELQREVERIEAERGKTQRREPDRPVVAAAKPEIPRSSSFRSGIELLKKPKRVHSFSTRRKTSLRKQPLPATTLRNYIERKQELLAGSKRSTNRSWKSFYVVLCEQILCFFHSESDFVENRIGATSPINLYGCSVAIASDYVKRKHVLRLKPHDGSEFLFSLDDKEILEEWLNAIKAASGRGQHDDSSSDEEILKPRSREPLYANEKVLEDLVTNGNNKKPPIPPRSSSIKDFDTVRGMPPPPPPKPRQSAYHSVYNTLPVGTTAPEMEARSSGSLPHQNDSSSESDSPKSKNKTRSSTGLLNLFKRKKATQL